MMVVLQQPSGEIVLDQPVVLGNGVDHELRLGAPRDDDLRQLVIGNADDVARLHGRGVHLDLHLFGRVVTGRALLVADQNASRQKLHCVGMPFRP